jgi:predicted cupin superfamily sugar epimerase
MTAETIIQKLDLAPHPEGGFYKRTFVSETNSFSSILFLLVNGNFSAFHQIKSDEQWNWYYGDAIVIHEIDMNGNYYQTVLSEEKVNFQYVVKGGNWFASECIGEHGYALCGCTVIPAFRFEDFILGKRDNLTKQFPQHTELIKRMTR